VNLEGDRTWTTDNFVKAMEALGKAGKIGISVYCGGQGGDQGTRALVSNLYGATIADKANSRYTMNSPEGVKALTLLKDLESKGYIDAGLSIAAAEELQLFAQQQIASTICWGTSNAKNYATNAFTQVSVPFPSNDGVPSLEYLVNGFCVFDNKDAAKAEAAKKLVQFISDDPVWGKKNVVQTGAFPLSTTCLLPGPSTMAATTTPCRALQPCAPSGGICCSMYSPVTRLSYRLLETTTRTPTQSSTNKVLYQYGPPCPGRGGHL